MPVSGTMVPVPANFPEAATVTGPVPVADPVEFVAPSVPPETVVPPL